MRRGQERLRPGLLRAECRFAVGESVAVFQPVAQPAPWLSQPIPARRVRPFAAHLFDRPALWAPAQPHLRQKAAPTGPPAMSVTADCPPRSSRHAWRSLHFHRHHPVRLSQDRFQMEKKRFGQPCPSAGTGQYWAGLQRHRPKRDPEAEPECWTYTRRLKTPMRTPAAEQPDECHGVCLSAPANGIPLLAVENVSTSALKFTHAHIKRAGLNFG